MQRTGIGGLRVGAFGRDLGLGRLRRAGGLFKSDSRGSEILLISCVVERHSILYFPDSKLMCVCVYKIGIAISKVLCLELSYARI